MAFRLGIDVGGTFTDICLLAGETGEISVAKVPSTPTNPAIGVENGIKNICKEVGIDPSQITNFIHGTTVATNALLEKKGAKTALVTTKGFKDLLHIGRQIRPNLYDFHAKRPLPLVPRHLRFEVPERVLFDGQVMKPLDESVCEVVMQEIKDAGVESVAVCLINSYANPVHEERIKEMFERKYPEIYISISSDILREYREYERMSTTVINAYVMPKIEAYIENLRNRIKKQGIGSELYIMQSNGGIITADTAMKKSVATILSGPAGGVLGGKLVASLAGRNNVITVDMGGTSFDMCIIYQGEPNYSTESNIAGYPIKLPMIDVQTIGAGGGSIGWVDKGGALRVGPHSAGAEPGPACYAKGGTEPTVTDANLILGRIGEWSLLGGRMKLDKSRAFQAIKEKIAKPLGLSVEEAAEGIIDVVNANMVRGIRRISVERGYDPREFALVAFGGAGPLHAASLARELDMAEVIIPFSPGVASAIGMLSADIRHDYVRTHVVPCAEKEVGTLNSMFLNMESEAKDQLEEEGVDQSNMVFIREVDMRYKGQGYELTIPLAGGELDVGALKQLVTDFHNAHERAYGYSLPEKEVEIVNLRLIALGKLAVPRFKRAPKELRKLEEAVKEYRPVIFEGKSMNTPVYERTKLRPGSILRGPAIVEQLDSTTVILPGQRAEVDEYFNILISEA